MNAPKISHGCVWRDIKTIYHPHKFLSLLLFQWQSTRDENWTLWCGYVWRENSCLYIYSGTIWAFNCGYVWRDIETIYHPHKFLSLPFFQWQSTRDENWKLWCGYVLQENSCLHIFSRPVIWPMYYLLTADNRPGFLWNVDAYAFV